jgi:molybdopterin molybdotransferase
LWSGRYRGQIAREGLAEVDAFLAEDGRQVQPYRGAECVEELWALRSAHSDATGDLSEPASVEQATAWIDGHTAPLEAEEVDLAEAAGRVLAQDAVAAADLPPFDRASVDGLAVRADDTAGASVYNPLGFRLAATGCDALSPYTGVLLRLGDPLPADADAVVPLAHIEVGSGGSCELIEASAPRSGVERKADQFARGATLLEAGRRLLPYDIALLAAAGVLRPRVIRSPKVRCFLTRPDGPLHDADGPLLRALIGRDGGTVAELRQINRDQATVRGALRAAAADAVIVVGGTGLGPDDASAAALAEAGTLAIRGVTLRPGETASLGRTEAGLPVFLLPGTPMACLWAYEFFAGRAIRHLAGRDPALPFRRREMRTLRKIASTIGMTEVCPVRCSSPDEVEPIASFAEAGLGSAVRADGFVIISAGSEGVPEGTMVKVNLNEEGACERPARRHDRH